MRRIKKRVSPVKIVLIVLVAIIAINIGARYIVSESHYEHNVAIESQLFHTPVYVNASQLEGFKYSFNQKTDNYSIISATHNVLRYLNINELYNKVIPIADIIKYHDLYAQLGFGHLGVNPLAVSWYFKSIGLKAEVFYDRENITERMANAEICVLFRTDFKMHEFRAVTYTSATNAKYYGPNQSFHIGNRINIEYKDLFLALITVSV